MKIGCECGAAIFDQTDALPHKAHIVPDQEFEDVVEAIVEAVERSGPSAEEKRAACNRVISLIRQRRRGAWQCRACGRLYIDDQRYELRAFLPDGPDVPREIFRSRPSPEP